MKRLITFFVLLISLHCSILKAQSQPITFNPNILAHSQGLPNEFLLFSSDTSVQILFNPARAALTSKRFVYTNYTPYSSLPLLSALQKSLNDSYQYELPYYSGQTISTAALFDMYGSTWLFQFSNTVDNYTNDFTLANWRTQQWSTIIDESGRYSDSRNGTVTAFKLSLIENKGENSFSIGAFGVIFPGDKNKNSINIQDEYRPPTTSSSSQANKKIINSLGSQNTNAKYTLGLEFTAVDADWDLVTNIMVQKNNIKGFVNSDYRDTYNSWNNTSLYFRETFSHSIKNLKTAPLIFGVNGYYQHKTDFLTPTDHYFIASNIYFSDSELNYDQNGYEVRWTQGTNYNPSRDSASYSLSQKLNTTDIITALSFGYLTSHKLIDIDILLGVNPQLGYYQYNEAVPFFYSSDYYDYFGNTISTIYKHRVLLASIQIPIHLNYTPTEWCSFYGGLNYRYSYKHENINSFKPTLENYSSSNSSTNSESYSDQLKRQTLSYLSSANNVFAGVELRHASGLRLQAAFRGNLSSFSNWHISLGYIY